jgi:hypothetical protein
LREMSPNGFLGMWSLFFVQKGDEVTRSVTHPETQKGATCLASRALPGNSSGGEKEDRTPDLRIANATLSQLSYLPTRERHSKGSRSTCQEPELTSPVLRSGMLSRQSGRKSKNIQGYSTFATKNACRTRLLKPVFISLRAGRPAFGSLLGKNFLCENGIA